MGDFHLQDHDGDDDGDHAIAEGFQAIRFHSSQPPTRQRVRMSQYLQVSLFSQAGSA